MSVWQSIKQWIASRADRRRFRFPALAEANKALMAVETEVVDFDQIKPQMDQFKEAQAQPERARDLAYIPIYLSIEEFVSTHQPPVVKQATTRADLRNKVRSLLDLEQMNENFRLVFLPDNQQADHFLKIGALELLRFLLTSLGRTQLEALIREAVGTTPLVNIEVNDDGVSFENAHKGIQSLPKADVIAMYKRLYAAIFNEIKNLFGEKEAIDLVATTRREIKERYDKDFVALYDSVLPLDSILS